jgi:hypothetical protein
MDPIYSKTGNDGNLVLLKVSSVLLVLRLITMNFPFLLMLTIFPNPSSNFVSLQNGPSTNHQCRTYNTHTDLALLLDRGLSTRNATPPFCRLLRFYDTKLAPVTWTIMCIMCNTEKDRSKIAVKPNYHTLNSKHCMIC